ncbi:hypothetical protein [Novosphingobium sp. KN65.2]|uniref:hypothetical protein n=1 Tax=Novosphingobium sp. KN65.2 TaxID=1478134 RepID=UPI0005E7EE24|nr:hypothetical protein [Novosphingobium sp. KN65.2]CDO38936.1 exported hypothetical protein [Novosphingobium sp. KN65.2]
MRKPICVLLATSALVAPLCSHAQSPAEQAEAAPQRDLAVGEIIVTAQKREERLNDVPVSITAASASQLEMRA